ncbi:olfactory receptor-like protein COR4 [Ambystoma mexicanum]|uniref:olfactory receptor-like protein COR4 n=1 Tax=Ambystoma mexicanum TaxID=8296 RepID=UPI0037E96237
MKIHQIINLSSHVLTKSQTSLLSLGLNFCPTVNYDYAQVRIDFDKFLRKIKQKKFFANIDAPMKRPIPRMGGTDLLISDIPSLMDLACLEDDQYDPSNIDFSDFDINPNWDIRTKLKSKSRFNPQFPVGGCIEAFHDLCIEDLRKLRHKAGTSKQNLTIDQRQALNELQLLSNIVIKPADKGSNVVIQDRTKYVIEANRQLHDRQCYIKMLKDPSEEIRTDLIALCTRWMNEGLLEDDLILVKSELIYIAAQMSNENMTSAKDFLIVGFSDLPQLQIPLFVAFLFAAGSKLCRTIEQMEGGNLSSLQQFIIVGFSDLPQLQVPLFVAFLLLYLITLVGNLLIMSTIYANAHLHTPMYFFLSNLSFIDISYTSVIFPKMLAHFFQEGIHISMTECLLQMYFFIVMLSTEVVFLTVMAYDRYVAICNPLRYSTIMSKAVCLRLAVGSWTVGFMDALPHTLLLSKLSFCKSHNINHFFCDVTALMKISCTSTLIVEVVTYIMGAILTVMSFVLIIISYVNIASSILKIKATGGRHKAFSTCASHLTVVILFYGSLFSTYMRPTSTFSMQSNKILSLSYIAITPLCNPIIYSLKNTDFKNVLRKTKNTT